MIDNKTFEYLPTPFKEAIKMDRVKPVIPDVININDIRKLRNELNEWQEKRNRVSQGCEQVISEMKKG